MGTAKTTYRVQGLPVDASPNDLKTIISQALGEDASILDPTIHSLASDPYRPPDSSTSTKVATVTFQHAPKALKDGDRLTADVTWDSKTHYITVDSSFGGFTPLNDPKTMSGDTIEWVSSPIKRCLVLTDAALLLSADSAAILLVLGKPGVAHICG